MGILNIGKVATLGISAIPHDRMAGVSPGARDLRGSAFKNASI